MSPPKKRKGKPKSAAPTRTRRLGGGGSGGGGGGAKSGGAAAKSRQQFWHGKDVEKACAEISAAIICQRANTTPAVKSIYGDDLSIATATVRSLGAPPLAGRETIAEHYFDAAYQRASVMAAALLEQAATD